MFYKEIEIVISEHLGSLNEDGHTVFAHGLHPFYRAQCEFGIIYANSEISAKQGIIELIDKSLLERYPS